MLKHMIHACIKSPWLFTSLPQLQSINRGRRFHSDMTDHIAAVVQASQQQQPLRLQQQAGSGGGMMAHAWRKGVGTLSTALGSEMK